MQELHYASLRMSEIHSNAVHFHDHPVRKLSYGLLQAVRDGHRQLFW